MSTVVTSEGLFIDGRCVDREPLPEGERMTDREIRAMVGAETPCDLRGGWCWRWGSGRGCSWSLIDPEGHTVGGINGIFPIGRPVEFRWLLNAQTVAKGNSRSLAEAARALAEASEALPQEG